MCNVSLSDDNITIPLPALLVPADMCQCWWWCSLCAGGWAACCHSILPPPPPHSLWNSSLGSVSVWIHHPPLTAIVTLPLPATDAIRL
ncbi:unnamed protein product [Staurois parvus]|uniref:Uncharacterized protein n=1 Tax=Staurois parvus TaxID=386267 RepID=A0ABN9FS32_9NEOB|nr:unnamed protein product [Staurois parvus]